jgi:transposase
MAYSQDLRERVMAAVETDTMSHREVAALYSVSESTIEKWLVRKRETGSVAALAPAGGRPRVLAPYGATLRAEVKRQPDLALSELCERMQAREGVAANTSMMCRELKRLNLLVKKSRSMTRNRKRRA